MENYKALRRIEHQLDIIQKLTTVSNNIEPVRKYLCILIILWLLDEECIKNNYYIYRLFKAIGIETFKYCF